MHMKMRKLKVKIQRYGSFLSAMMMPSIPAFIGWGILAALFIPTGWFPNENLNTLIEPSLKYLLPLLIGFTGGYNIYGLRGGVAGAVATMGVVIGADVTMLFGGMIMGPVGGWIIRKSDELIEKNIRVGYEMLISNFSLGIIGALLMISGYLIITPVFDCIIKVLTFGVQWIVERNFLPFVSFLVQPGDVLFLNNAINHGVFVPLGIEQAAQSGTSILFLVEANGGIWCGMVLAYCLFAKGYEKTTAISTFPIVMFGGIGEVAYPYVLMHPSTILGPIVGNVFALLVLQLLGGGTVAAVSPGSIFALILMSPKHAMLPNLLAYFGGGAVSCITAGFFLLRINREQTINSAAKTSLPIRSTVRDEELCIEQWRGMKKVGIIPSGIRKIVIACDAGMGSSAMGASVLKSMLEKEMMKLIVQHESLDSMDTSADLIITTDVLLERAIDSRKNEAIPVIGLHSLLDKAAYETIIREIKERSI